MAGRRETFVAFYEATWRRTVACAYGITGDLTAAEDLAQEAYCRAWRRWRTLEEYDDPVAWVRRTATRLAVSRVPVPAVPENLEELSAVEADVAGCTRAPGPDRAIATSRRRTARVAAAATTVTLLVVLLAAVAAGGSSDAPEPVPGPVFPGEIAVWYDEAGLHRGEVVETTPGRLRELTLVRSGAVYTDLANDVWFHPWGGTPRMIGSASTGPAGDPDGDNAAWFEGRTLVVHDTAARRDIAHVATPPGSRILEVSAGSVVWTGRQGATLRLDVRTRHVSELLVSSPMDVYRDAEAWSSGADDAVSIRRWGDVQEYPGIGPRAWFSPDGAFLLAVSGNAVTIVDLRNGELFHVRVRGNELVASWAYGHVAVIVATTDLLACDAHQRDCRRVATYGDDVVLPSEEY